MAEPFFSTPKKIQTEYEKQKELEGNNVESDSQIEDNSRSIQLLWKSVGTKNTILVSKVSYTFHPRIVSYWVTDEGGGYYSMNTDGLISPAGRIPNFAEWNRYYFGYMTQIYPYFMSNSWFLTITSYKEIEIPIIDMKKYSMTTWSNWTIPELVITNRLEKFYRSNPNYPGDPLYNYWQYGTINENTTHGVRTVNHLFTFSPSLSIGYFKNPISGDFIYNLYIYATEL
jgi:hypothetical protein